MRFGSKRLSAWLEWKRATLCLGREADGRFRITIVRPAKDGRKGRSVTRHSNERDDAVQQAVKAWGEG